MWCAFRNATTDCNSWSLAAVIHPAYMPKTGVCAAASGHGALAWNNARKSVDPPFADPPGHATAAGKGWNQMATDDGT